LLLCKPLIEASLDAEQHRDQKFHRQDPDQQNLPKPQVPRRPVISSDVRVPIKPVFPMPQDMDSNKKHRDQANAEKNSQRDRDIAEFVNRFC
jgi:hypothetical protein